MINCYYNCGREVELGGKFRADACHLCLDEVRHELNKLREERTEYIRKNLFDYRDTQLFFLSWIRTN